MKSSPFHGIFSSFGNERGAASSAPMNSFYDANEEEEVVAHAKSSSQGVGQIAVDIYELDDYYIIRAPIAGVRLSDLDIEVDEKVITIRGNRQPSDNIPKNQFYVQECFWGEFSRSVTLPTMIDPKKVKATFSKDSILKILVPKEERVKIVRISEG